MKKLFLSFAFISMGLTTLEAKAAEYICQVTCAATVIPVSEESLAADIDYWKKIGNCVVKRVTVAAASVSEAWKGVEEKCEAFKNEAHPRNLNSSQVTLLTADAKGIATIENSCNYYQ